MRSISITLQTPDSLVAASLVTMRLININTLEFEEFFDDNIPSYAILSHRWSRDEVTFSDYRKGRRKDSAGYQKVRSLCDITAKYNTWLQKQGALYGHETAAWLQAHRGSYSHDEIFRNLAFHDQETKALDWPHHYEPSHAQSILKPENPWRPINHVWVDTCCIDKRSSAEKGRDLDDYRRKGGREKVAEPIEEEGQAGGQEVAAPDAVVDLDKTAVNGSA